jgi:hypothetical protein
MKVVHPHVSSSHVAMISHPQVVADAIIAAVDGLGRSPQHVFRMLVAFGATPPVPRVTVTV